MATAVDTNALTSMASVKRHLGITSSEDDVLLVNLINQTSEQIERIANRRFKARDWHFWVNIYHGNTLVLPQWPVVYVNRISYGSTQALTIAYSGAAIRATAQVYRNEQGSAGGVRLVSYDSTGSRTTNELTAASNASTDAMATAITAVSGWTGTAVVNVPTLDLYPTGGIDCDDVTIGFDYPYIDDDNYRIDYDDGIIELVFDTTWGDFATVGTSKGFQAVIVEARCGYETVPADIELLANEMVGQAFASRGKDFSYASESIGDYSYSLVNPMGIAQGVAAKLSHYRRIGVAGSA